MLCRFSEKRPGLVVLLLPYCQASTGLDSSLIKSLPVVQAKEMFLVGTAVATRVPVFYKIKKNCYVMSFEFTSLISSFIQRNNK